MQKYMMMTLGLLFCSTNLNATENACPVLNLNTLPAASCATSNSVFKTGPLSQMDYVSKTPCPRGIGVRKKLQGMFKGKKDYLGVQKNKQDGIVACTYNLDQAWQKALATNSQTLQLTAPIQSNAQANHLSQAVCPDLKKEDVGNISDRGVVSIMESTRNKDANFTFSSAPLPSAGKLAGLKSMFRSNKDLRNLKGTMQTVKPFSQICEYQHNTGGSPVVLILEGRQDMRRHR